LPAYEISNHARPGQECRHNLEIWRGGDYAGIGPGAHGRLSGNSGADRLYQIHDPGRWLARVEADGFGTAKRIHLTPSERGEEIFMTALRLGEGVRASAFKSLTGLDIHAMLDANGLRRMVDGGFVQETQTGLRATAAGRLCLNEVLRQLLA